MTQGYTRSATLDDIDVLAKDLRDADKSEIKAASGCTPKVAMSRGIGIANSGHGVAKVICLPSGTPCALYGIVRDAGNPRVGSIWMVATNQFKTLHRQFLRECCSELSDICSNYDLVYNYTDARNTVHHRWIKWSGFTFINRVEEFGAEKRPFLEFVRLSE